MSKICVYAIAKNEIKFIDRWYNSVKEADYICVLDTGSTDGSFEKFKELGIITKQKNYESFRFDIARNDSMTLIPNDTDICVCVDLDEIFVPGWSKILKENWNNNTTQARYRYTWNFNTDGSEGVVFMLEKIHKYNLFKWKNPVHEILTPAYQFQQNIIDLPSIQLNHYADTTKSRSSYLPLLELAIKEDPTNDRNMHYLGREYLFYGMYDKSINILKKHLQLPSALWKEERCASLRYIAECYKQKNKPTLQEKYLLLAILEYNQAREPYFELAKMYYHNKKYLKACFMFEEMFKITHRNLNYISSPICWGSIPYDYLSMCYYYLKNYKQAINCINNAITLSNEQRLKENLKIFINCYKKTKKQH